MEKNLRLRKNRDYNLVYKKGKKFYNRYFILIIKKKGKQNTRVGFSITKKYGNAVERNRMKRQLREIIRKQAHSLKKGIDMVVIPKKNTKELSFSQLNESLRAVLEKSKSIE